MALYLARVLKNLPLAGQSSEREHERYFSASTLVWCCWSAWMATSNQKAPTSNVEIVLTSISCFSFFTHVCFALPSLLLPMNASRSYTSTKRREATSYYSQRSGCFWTREAKNQQMCFLSVGTISPLHAKHIINLSLSSSHFFSLSLSLVHFSSWL